MPKDIRVTVGVQISEDGPVPGSVFVAEGIRLPEDIRIPKNIRLPEHFRVFEIFGNSTEKNKNYPTRPNSKKCSTRTRQQNMNLYLNPVSPQSRK